MDQIVKQDSPNTRMRDKAKQLLQEINIEQLPTLPNILLSLLKTHFDDHDTLEQFAKHFDKDPALRIRLLSISPHDASNDTAQALQQLDKHSLKNLAITSTAQQYFSDDRNQDQNRFLKQHWQYALLCASIAKAIAEQCQYKYPEEAYTAGLLHDIGQLVLHCAYPDIYATISAQNEGDAALHELESSEFACNHLYIGAELLKLHHANSFLSDAILYHHEPVERIVDAHPLVRIIHLANQISNTDFNLADKSIKNAIFDRADQLLGLPRSAVIKILSEANTRLNDCAVEYEIDLDDDDADNESARVIQSRAEYVQTQLDEQIKYLSLLDGLHQQLSRISDERDLFDAIAQYSKRLFGTDGNMVFLYEDNNRHLRNVAPKDNGHLADLIIPLKENCSIISDCLLKKETLHSFLHDYHKLSIIDQQLLSATSKQGMICLPLISHQQDVGVLVLGADRLQQASLWNQLLLLEHFTREIAQTIYSRHSSSKTDAGLIDFDTHIREVIHEVNNPLSIINNYLEILSLKLGDENQAQTDIQTIKSEIHRVGDILQRMKTPAIRADSTTKVDINALISELSGVFETSILASKNIRLSIDLDQSLAAISCNANALKQIYTNLVKNAVEALPANGEIMVYTQDQVNVDGKTFIEISVADNGPGIHSEVLSRLFTPVQTEKGDGHAGIGLSIVSKLVDELNGSISCRSNNRGTRFQILLPNK
ncbi:HDOD domain-containing protein [Pseudomonadota bacterium]